MQKHPETIDVRKPWDTGTSKKDDPYTNLAVAVLMGAVEDYINILKKLLKGDLTDSEIIGLQSEKRVLERIFHSKIFGFYMSFLSTEIDPEAIIKLAPIRAKERLEEERKKEEEKAKKAAEKAAKEAAEKAAKEQAEREAKEQAEAKQDNTENNNNSTADKAESEDAQ